MEYTDEMIDSLEAQHNLNTKNIDIINQLAIAYLNTPSRCSLSLDLFKKAYDLYPSIKTATNYAHELILDNVYGDLIDPEVELGIKILEPFIFQNPNSHMPYGLIGYGYFFHKDYVNAIVNFKISLSKKFCPFTVHNLATCLSHLGKYPEAIQLFNQILDEEDIDDRTTFNLVICYIENGSISKALELIEKLSKEETHWTSEYEIAKLYFNFKEDEKAFKILDVNEDLCGLSILDEPIISYIIFKSDPKLFFNIINNGIKNISEWIDDYQNPKEEEFHYTKEEKKSEINEYLEQISKLKILHHHLNYRPEINLKELYVMTAGGCWLYDCKVHNTNFNDDNCS